MKGIDILVNIASIGFGHAPNIVNAALESGIKRVVFISTTALFTTLNAPSKSVRLAAEATIRNSMLDYTILRPTMIYGSPRDRNMSRLVRYLHKYPVFPILGDGECLQQPVNVEDVAGAVVKALGSEKTIGKAYNIPGAKALTMNQVVDTISGILNRRTRKVHLPAAPFVKGLIILENFGIKLPIKSEQMLRLNEDKAFPFDAAMKDFGFAPLDFEEGIRREIHAMDF
jgi:nucleoside-diphosphate-sugar epimerase